MPDVQATTKQSNISSTDQSNISSSVEPFYPYVYYEPPTYLIPFASGINFLVPFLSIQTWVPRLHFLWAFPLFQGV